MLRPLLGEYETLTTAKIAQAAGIGEAHLLAVFADKEAAMQACVATLTEALTAVFDSEDEVRQIGAIRTDQPLASRLVKVIDILDAPSEIREAVTTLLEPDQHHLRLPADILAKAFVGMTFGGVRPEHPDQPPLPAEQVVDLFLHGALNTG